MKNYDEKFINQWKESRSRHWFEKFSVKPRKKVTLVQQEWFWIWDGPLWELDGKEVIPGVTIVGGYECNPNVYDPREFLGEYYFTNIHPCKGRRVWRGCYYKELNKIKRQILAYASYAS